MPGLISNKHGDDLDFELFSNIVLKFTAILMVVLVLLAINIGQKLDQIISPYRFSGGVARPQIYVGAFAPEDWINVQQKMTVQIYSASFFQAATVVDPSSGGVSARHDTETFSGWHGDRAYGMLSLLAGISPGSIAVGGKDTPFVVPHFTNKFMAYHDKANKSRSSPPSEQLALNFLKLWSPAYANPVYPTRAFSEYNNIKTRIYLSTTGQHDLQIGHVNFSTAWIKSGQLDFLTAMSSANTEIVYLGQYSADALLDFYNKNGFTDAAKHLRYHRYPGAADLEDAKDYYSRLTTWDQLAPEQKPAWIKAARGNDKRARSQYEQTNARRAINDYSDAQLEDALLKNTAPDVRALPTILAYPEAWQAYVEDRLKSSPTPPEWVVTEFLEPLGFDKRVIQLEAEAK